MKRSHALFLTLLAALSFTGVLLAREHALAPHKEAIQRAPDPEPVLTEERILETVSSAPEASPEQRTETATDIPPLPVPFTSQAPTAKWGDDTFQNGCEEASLIMAAHWLSGKPFMKEGAEQEIVALSAFEEKRFGHAVDTSAADTARLFQEYYGYLLPEVRYDITAEDIRSALAEGAVVIVPTNGRKLGNPNFKRPGPLTHMLAVIGYDAAKKEFITNDPGTRLGKGYRYAEETLLAAVRDYPTGKHLPIAAETKAMIIIRRP